MLRNAGTTGKTSCQNWICRATCGTGGWLVVFCLMTFTLLPVARGGDTAPIKSGESTLKAAFLCSFPDYVTWPDSEGWASGKRELWIGLLSDEAFADSVEQVVKKKKETGQRFKLKRSRSAQDLADCQVVFISNSESERLRQHLAAFQGKPILTVSDCAGFLDAGGIIEFLLDAKRLRFEVDLGRAETCGLKLRASMLNLAKNVRRKEGGAP